MTMTMTNDDYDEACEQGYSSTRITLDRQESVTKCPSKRAPCQVWPNWATAGEVGDNSWAASIFL